MKEDPDFPKTYLVDASILIAGAFESNKKAQDVIFQQKIVYTIELAEIESVNVLKSKKLELDHLQKFQQILLAKNIVKLPLQKIDFETAFRIAKDCDVTVYDALYHAVALKLFLTFATLDDRYYQKTKDIGWVELVG